MQSSATITNSDQEMSVVELMNLLSIW